MPPQFKATKQDSLELSDAEVELIYQAEPKKSGNGAVIYLPLRHKKKRVYVVVCK